MSETSILSNDETFLIELQAKESLLGEIVAKIESARAEHAEVIAGTAQAVAAERLVQDGLKLEIEKLKFENEKLKAEAGDFHKRVATEVAKFGIRKDAVLIGALGGNGKPTATEEILNAKGVSSLAELEAK